MKDNYVRDHPRIKPPFPSFPYIVTHTLVLGLFVPIYLSTNLSVYLSIIVYLSIASRTVYGKHLFKKSKDCGGNTILYCTNYKKTEEIIIIATDSQTRDKYCTRE